eukprot:CAMPEP_0204183410 /NCGR_PEP_ID=MMETSP0361-20130328/53592_1 /ASSEMBLY_ACC=CAM_ASM_000343 /TAXON_ID=268821 /ORGANISM="Scrippsiella Hangoei, Strain SHTV-5" /LENGTH=51 /DNA_ID=CAMNT_0051143297 /DNA_START=44 /DNA_END=197 /DNA_ORIENTATION=-
MVPHAVAHVAAVWDFGDACECMPNKQAAPQLKPGMISRGHVRPDGARPAAT